ncbi:MAG: hypothetical protein IJE51_01215 [Clostridia bacterium]|nr:hypothetical protein [Clostridia bacterium]
MKRTIRFKRSTQPKKRVNKWWIVFLVFVGLLAFFVGFMAVRPVFMLFGLVS